MIVGTEIDMTDFKTAVPVVLTSLRIALTFSIAEGIGFGLISAALLARALSESTRMTVLGYVLAAIFFL